MSSPILGAMPVSTVLVTSPVDGNGQFDPNGDYITLIIDTPGGGVMEVRVASSCAYSLAGEIEGAVCPNWPWLPMSALPNDDRIVIAQAIDGRVLHIPSALLRFAGSNTTPDHLAFPAVRWRRLGPGAA